MLPDLIKEHLRYRYGLEFKIFVKPERQPVLIIQIGFVFLSVNVYSVFFYCKTANFLQKPGLPPEISLRHFLSNFKEIILCKENEKDILEIPQDYLKGLSFHYVETVSDVLDYALLK